MSAGEIIIRGARQHNLKNVDLSLPRGRLIVFTGVSGSGKSSLAFDTLYVEGQRRYVESLSAYARQFLGQFQKPACDAIKGLSPTIAITQGRQSNNPRSTVGTITEIHDYLRVLFARVGRQHCPACGAPIETQSVQEIVHEISRLPPGTRYSLLAPVPLASPGATAEALMEARAKGFVRVRFDGEIHALDDLPPFDARVPHRLDVVVDRLVQRDGLRQRLADSVETALAYGHGRCILLAAGGEERVFADRFECPACATAVPAKTPQLFSFNHPQGMCPECQGIGTCMVPDPGKLVPNPDLTLEQGAVVPWANVFARKKGTVHATITAALEAMHIPTDVPFRALSREQQDIIFNGAGDRTFRATWKSKRGRSSWDVPFEGIIPLIERRLRETRSEGARRSYLSYLSETPCEACGGRRLRREALAVTVGGRSIADLQSLSLDACMTFLDTLEFSGTDARIAGELLKEVRSRLALLVDLGLSYLTLGRPGPTLSGGEGQRIRLASQIGSELTGVLYVLDEPSVGLHPRDTRRLLDTLKRLRDLGNTVVVVEHDRATILEADHVVDFGPGAGVRGGRVLFSGPPRDLAALEDSRTGGYLSGRLRIGERAPRALAGRPALTIRGATHHNLQNVDVSIPLGHLVVVTGVSGAGKSSLINDTLYPALANRLHHARLPVGAHRCLEGAEHLDKVVHVDQAPIGRSHRSTPATYAKVFDAIRALFAQLPEARVRGYGPRRFSFNEKGGRCEACSGDGTRRIAMHFLPDIHVPCEVCGGRRFNEATLEVKYRNHSIADILEMTVEEVYALLRNHAKIARILRTMIDVGLGYLPLGQPATTLSGGEAQRLKLSRELARPDTGRTLYLLDEPTTGLHFDDVSRLLDVLDRLVEAGNTVVVIEHHPGVIRCADTVIDLGPEGGDQGGRIIAAGPPCHIATVEASHTGRVLRAESTS